jgi:hypothetical protein
MEHMDTTRFQYTPGNVKTAHMYALVGGSLLLIFAGFAITLLPGLGGDLDYRTLFQNDDGSLLYEPIVLGIALLLLFINGMANRKAYLKLSGNTLEVHIPRLTAIGLTGLTTGQHRIPLSTVQRLELVPADKAKNLGMALNQSRLLLVTDRQTYRFQPYHFREEGKPDHRLGFTEIMGKQQERVATVLQESPLTRALAGVVGDEKLVAQAPERTGPLADQFNLLTHKGMLAALALLTVLGGYALVDYLMLTNYLVLGDLPLWPFVSAGLIAAVAGIKLGKGAPNTEKLGVTAILTIASVMATYPGVQRYTLLAEPQPQSVNFEVADTAYFIADNYPAIDQRQSNIQEYWQQQPPGSQYSFQIHPAVMGFAMVDMSPVYEQSRAFYAAR